VVGSDQITISNCGGGEDRMYEGVKHTVAASF